MEIIRRLLCINLHDTKSRLVLVIQVKTVCQCAAVQLGAEQR